MKQVRAYRRIGTIDGVEVHRSPVSRDIIDAVPEDADLISRTQLEAYEEMVADAYLGIKEQHTFVIRENGQVLGILVGFFVGDSAYREEYEELGYVLQEVLSSHAYIDALEVYEKRRGVGRKLFQAFEKWAKERGAVGIAGSPMGNMARMFDEAMGMAPHPDDDELWVKQI